MLKLMYITNDQDVARIAENAGVDRIFVDMEYIGKDLRQGGMDTVQSHHTVEDVKKIKSELTKAELLVRINPIHEATNEYCSSAEEIEQVIEAGADIIMLPFFKTCKEVADFLQCVDGRVKTMLLVETPEAVECIDEIIELPGIDEMYIGLNDLSLGYGMKFMFQLLADGTVEKLSLKFKQKNLPYGFGGIAALGKGMLPAENIIVEHYRLKSSRVILSRSFCRTEECTNLHEIKHYFDSEVQKLRKYEKKASALTKNEMMKNKKEVNRIVQGIKEN